MANPTALPSVDDTGLKLLQRKKTHQNGQSFCCNRVFWSKIEQNWQYLNETGIFPFKLGRFFVVTEFFRNMFFAVRWYCPNTIELQLSFSFLIAQFHLAGKKQKKAKILKNKNQISEGKFSYIILSVFPTRWNWAMEKDPN